MVENWEGTLGSHIYSISVPSLRGGSNIWTGISHFYLTKVAVLYWKSNPATLFDWLNIHDKEGPFLKIGLESPGADVAFMSSEESGRRSWWKNASPKITICIY